MRVDFIRLLRDEWELYASDLGTFLDRPQSRAYRVWFKEVRCKLYNPEIYREETLVQSAFVQRVHQTAGLWRSIHADGFNRSVPIRLGSGRRIEPVNGKTINSVYFAGDGCHRIACLNVTGRTRLQPEHYEVRLHRRFQPLDVTSILIDRLPLDRTTYLHFLSRFYCDGLELGASDLILQYVARERANLLPELQSVLAFDLGRTRHHG